MSEGAASESLLGRYGGEPPPAAPWFAEAVAVAPVRTCFEQAGAAIELLVWGDVGRPGLLFLHGNGAHADWWSFIAPFFADRYRCAAISWSGMGGSDWRSRYSIEGYADELFAAIDVAELSAAGPPLVVGHSFGGVPLMSAAVRAPSRLAGGIMVDSFVPPRRRPQPGWLVSGKPPPVYPTLAAALARYRFSPPQTSAHPEVVDALARGSLRETPDGWTWRFDPQMWATLDRSGADPLVERAAIPMGILYGAQSDLVTADHVATLAARLPDCRFAAAIPGARHHIMVDQPLALVAALRVGLAALATKA